MQGNNRYQVTAELLYLMQVRAQPLPGPTCNLKSAALSRALRNATGKPVQCWKEHGTQKQACLH